MAQKLKKFQVHKVSIVPYGANDETIQLHKSADSEVVLFKSADYQGGKLMFDKLKKDDAPPGEMSEEEKKKKEEEEKKKEEEKTEKSAPSKKNPLKKEAEAGAGKETPEEEKKEEEEKKKEEEKTEKSAPVDIDKAVSIALAKALAPIQAENAELRKSLAIETSIRETQEYVEKAATYLPSLGKPSEVGPVILAIEKSNLSPTHKEAIQNLLIRAESMTKAAQPMLFKSMGYDGAAKVTDSAAEEINKLAQGLIQKSEKPLDLAAARSLIRKQYPDLANREREEARTVR
jgi:hypothetical protein